jgi:hypothetical protein
MRESPSDERSSSAQAEPELSWSHRVPIQAWLRETVSGNRHSGAGSTMPSVVELSEITEKNRGAVESLGVW